MPFCPSCRSEYRAGFTACADCGVDLVDELPPDARSIAGQEADVAVARASSLPIGQMWAELLGEHGISCRLAPVNAADNVYVSSQGGGVEVRVRGIDAARAQELLPREAHLIVAEPEAEAEVADAPLDRGLRWLVLIGVVLVVVLLIALAVSRSAANGFL